MERKEGYFMKRKLFALTLTLLTVLALAVPAQADIVWEPIGNSFYDAHRDGCKFVDRTYLTNGPQGYVTLRKAPGAAEEVYSVPNGESVYVGWSFPMNGAEWGAFEYGLPKGDGWEWKSGWAPMTELALIYDSTAFAEDHEAEFREYDGSGDALTKVCLYSYPGGVLQDTLEESREYMPFSEAFQHLYTDENGHCWSYVGYYMGHRDAWACLDDSLNEGLGVDPYPTVSAVRETGNGAIVPPAEHVPETAAFPVWLLPAGLVVAAAAVTAVLMRRRT